LLILPLYAKATKQPWHSKTAKNWEKLKESLKPGQVVSVDQLISPTPGLIAQMTGFFITKKHYKVTSHWFVDVNQASSLGFILHLQQTASIKETLENKTAFQWYAVNHGVTIMNYHADNGIFKAKEWVQAHVIRKNKDSRLLVLVHTTQMVKQNDAFMNCKKN
jgi:hypothetical protein